MKLFQNENIKDLIEIYKKFPQDKRVLIIIGAITGLIIFLFLLKLKLNNYSIIGGNFDFESTAFFGDFIGGVIGTIFTGAGFYFLYVTLAEQRKAIENQEQAFKTERFEARFFEMLNLHYYIKSLVFSLLIRLKFIKLIIKKSCF
jgi:hypothetical protein